MSFMRLAKLAFCVVVMAMTPVAAQASAAPFVSSFNTITNIASTVPKNGDVNPYGLVVVPSTTGRLWPAMRWSATSTIGSTFKARVGRSSRSRPPAL